MYGLYLVELGTVPIAKQHAFSGLPVVLCSEHPAASLNDTKTHIGSYVGKLRNKQSDKPKEIKPYEQVILDIADLWAAHKPKPQQKVLLPYTSGKIAVTREGKRIDAGTNAAVNIGLSAVLDPNWEGSYVKLSCDKSGKILLRKGDTAPAILQEIKDVALVDVKSIEKAKRSIINVWRDISTAPLKDADWQYTLEYWQACQNEIFKVLKKINTPVDK
jgi:hypothetical protein